MIRATATFRPRGDLGQFVQARITPAVKASVTAACDLIQQTAQGYCPVDTGNLRDSIKTTVEETAATVKGTVSTDVSYAEFVEYGTGLRGDPSVPHTDKPGMSPQPFMRPAIDENRDVIAELFRNNLSLAVKNG